MGFGVERTTLLQAGAKPLSFVQFITKAEIDRGLVRTAFWQPSEREQSVATRLDRVTERATQLCREDTREYNLTRGRRVPGEGD